MKKIILGCFILFAHTLNAQQNSIWCFGDSAGIDFNIPNNPITFSSASLSRGSCVAISDSNGVLQFYAHSMYHPLWSQGYTKLTAVHSMNGALMQNGDSIFGEGWYHELAILPNPGSQNLFYLFSIGLVFTPGLYYSIIDMSANGGLGAVIQKNIQLNNVSNADCVTAIKHGNGRDWWVISKENNSSNFTNEFYVFIVTPDTIALSSVQTLNNASNGGLQALVFNTKGDKLMQTHRAGFMCEYDFDRCTGIISNPNLIYPEQVSNFNRIIFNSAYSPDGSKSYISTSYYTNNDTSYLIQYDLTATDIPASADTLGRVEWPVQGGAVRLAPDGKVYYSCFYDWGFPGFPYPDTVHNIYNENLGVIHNPDSLGAGCDYQPFSFNLGGRRTYYGLPNNPDYSLGALVGSPCDTLTSSIATIEVKPTLHLFYHSGWQTLFVNGENLIGKNCILQIYDLSGRKVYEYSNTTSPPYFTRQVTTNGWSNGLYIVSLSTEKERSVRKFVK